MTYRFYYQSDCTELAQRYHAQLEQYTLGQTYDLIDSSSPFNNKFLIRLPENQPTLLLDKKGLWLAQHLGSHALKMQPDWLAQQRRVVNAGKKSELLLKAAKITADMHVIDATAGLGHDSLLMAGRGAKVTLLEQHPLMHALLMDAMQHISQQPNWHALHARLTLMQTDATQYLAHIERPVDLVYLDPMFPEDSYKSAQVNKNMQVLHTLAPPPTAEEENNLLVAARHAGKRVIVKRPRHAPFLACIEPSTQWLGDAVRFDGYMGDSSLSSPQITR